MKTSFLEYYLIMKASWWWGAGNPRCYPGGADLISFEVVPVFDDEGLKKIISSYPSTDRVWRVLVAPGLRFFCPVQHLRSIP